MEIYEFCNGCNERLAAYLRVASLAVAAYDCMWTIPVEIQIYADQKSIVRMGRGCVLFILIRYTSMITLIAGNIGYFKDDFTLAQCERYLYLTPVLKCIQMAIAHIILFVRTWAISRRSTPIFWTLACLFVVCIVLEFWSSVVNRVPVENDGSCTSGNDQRYKVAWIYYMTSTVFDLACLVIATTYLWLQSIGSSALHGLSRSLMKEGMLFFAALLAINMVNMAVYLKAQLEGESAAASLGYTITWIMAQRILIQLHKLRGRPNTQSRSCSVSDDGLGEQTHRTHALRFEMHTRKTSATTAGVQDAQFNDGRIAVHVEERIEKHVEADLGEQWEASSGGLRTSTAEDRW
ncbi:hypothetical protein B0H21DRAFT_207050 [Amylocystis lapponica]|nr:hypothetical protein B0H21DRAFT_207050 [Amylocystis lapponica]